MPLSDWLYNPSYFENVVLFVGPLIAMINVVCSSPPILSNYFGVSLCFFFKYFYCDIIQHTISMTHIRYTVQGLLIYSQGCAPTTTV